MIYPSSLMMKACCKLNQWAYCQKMGLLCSQWMVLKAFLSTYVHCSQSMLLATYGAQFQKVYKHGCLFVNIIQVWKDDDSKSNSIIGVLYWSNNIKILSKKKSYLITQNLLLHQHASNFFNENGQCSSAERKMPTKRSNSHIHLNIIVFTTMFKFAHTNYISHLL